jgi:hypothetical protein
MEKQKWIDEVLKSTENMERAGAGPFFLEKILNRIGSVPEAETFSYRSIWLLRASLATLIIINVIFISTKFKTEENKTTTDHNAIYTELSKELGYVTNYNY